MKNVTAIEISEIKLNSQVTSPDKNERDLLIDLAQYQQIPVVEEDRGWMRPVIKSNRSVHYESRDSQRNGPLQTDTYTNRKTQQYQDNQEDIFETNPNQSEPLLKKYVNKCKCRKLDKRTLKRSAELKRILKISILVTMASIFFLIISLLTRFSADSGSGAFETYNKSFHLNIDIMNCKILINENEDKNVTRIDYDYKINYLLDYFSEKPEIKMIDQENGANITVKSKKLLWRTCALTLNVPKDIIFTELNINCTSECILVSNHANITIINGLWESSKRLDMNWRSMFLKETLNFESIYGTFQLNEFKFEGEASINLNFGDVILQSSYDVSINWENPSLAYCFAGPFIKNDILNNCSYVSYGDDPSIENASNISGICSGAARICREEICLSPSKVNVSQISGNTYVNLLPETGVDVSYNPSLQISRGDLNSSIGLEDNFDKEIQKDYNSTIKDKDPILIINLGNKNLQQQSFQKWIISSNPSFAYLRPWWLAVFSANLLTSRTIEYSGVMAPGVCPYHFAGSLTEYFDIQSSLKNYFKLDQAEINFIKPMNTKEPSNVYQNGTGVVALYNEKPISESWLKVVQDSEGIFKLEDLDVMTRKFILPTLILSFLGAGLIGLAITKLFMMGIVIAHKKIMRIARHTQSYKENSVDFRASEEEKVLQELLEVENPSEEVVYNLSSILKEGSFLEFMKTVPRVSAFFGFYSYLLIKTYVLNSVEDFCNVIFLKQPKEKLDELMKNQNEREKLEMKEIRLKSNYEKFCFLNLYPELSLLENIRIFHSYGYDLVQDKDALVFSNLIERKNTKIPPIEELLLMKEDEIFDCIFNAIYERSTIETDTIFLDEIKYNCKIHSDKFKLSGIAYLDSEQFIQKNGLNKVYKKSLKLVYSELLSRKNAWYVNLIVATFNFLGCIFEGVVNLFNLVFSKLTKRRYPYRFKRFQTRKDNFHIIDEVTLKEHFNIISSTKPIQVDNSESVEKQMLKSNAIKKTLYYPYYYFHELIFVILHFLVTAFLIFPFIILSLMYEINYEPYSTVSSDQLISLRDLHWAPFELTYRLGAFIWWNLIIVCLIFIFVIFNVFDDITYFLDMTFPEDRKLLKFQDEMIKKKKIFIGENEELVDISKCAKFKSKLIGCLTAVYMFWNGRKFINFYWICVFFMIFCYSSYMGLVLLWLLLGSIINPSTFLVYSASSMTFITFASTKYYQFDRLSAEGLKVIKGIVYKTLQDKVNEITKLLAQELGRAMIGLSNIKNVQTITSFAVEQSRELGVENELNEIKSYSDNPEKILEGVFDNLETLIVNPEEIRSRIITKKDNLIKKAQKTFKTYCEAYNVPSNVVDLMTDLVLKTNKDQITKKIADLLEKQIPDEYNINFPKNLTITLISLVATHKSTKNRHELYYQLIRSIVMNIVTPTQPDSVNDTKFTQNFGKLISMIMNQSEEKSEIILEIIPTIMKLLQIKLPHWLNSLFENVLPKLVRGSGHDVQKAIIRLIAENINDERQKKIVAFILLLDKSQPEEEILSLKLDDLESLKEFFRENFGTDLDVSELLAYTCLILKGGYHKKKEIMVNREDGFTKILQKIMNKLELPNFQVDLIKLLIELGNTKLNSGKLAKLYKIGKTEKYFGELVCLLTENMWKNHFNNRLNCLKESDIIKLMAKKIGASQIALINMLKIFWASESEQFSKIDDYGPQNRIEVKMKIFEVIMNEDLSRIPDKSIQISEEGQINSELLSPTGKILSRFTSNLQEKEALDKKKLLRYFIMNFKLGEAKYDEVFRVTKNCEYFSKAFSLNKDYFKLFIFILNKFRLMESLNFFLRKSEIRATSNDIKLEDMISDIIELDKKLKSTNYITKLNKFMENIIPQSKEGIMGGDVETFKKYFEIMKNIIDLKKEAVIKTTLEMCKGDFKFSMFSAPLERFLKVNSKMDCLESPDLKQRRSLTPDKTLTFNKPILEHLGVMLWKNISECFTHFYGQSPYTIISLTNGFNTLKIMALVLNWTRDIDFLKEDPNFKKEIESIGVPLNAIEIILDLKYFYTIDPMIFLSRFVRNDQEIVEAIISILYMNPDYRLISQYLKMPRYQVDSMLSFLKLWTIEKSHSSDINLLNEVADCETVNLWCRNLGIIKSELFATLKIYFNLLRESDLDSIISDLNLTCCFRIDIFKSIIGLFSYKIMPEPLVEKGNEREFTILRKKIILLKSLDIENAEEYLFDLDFRAGNFHNLRTLAYYWNNSGNIIRSNQVSNLYFYVLGCMICNDFSEIDPNFIINDFIYAERSVLSRNSFKSIAFWFFKKFNVHPLILLYKLEHQQTQNYMKANLTEDELTSLDNILSSDKLLVNIEEDKFRTIFRKLLNEEQFPEYASITKLIWEQRIMIMQNFNIILLIYKAKKTFYKELDSLAQNGDMENIDNLIFELVEINGCRNDRKPNYNIGVFEKENTDNPLVKFGKFLEKIRPNRNVARVSKIFGQSADNDLFTLLESKENRYVDASSRVSPIEIVIEKYIEKFGIISEKTKLIFKMFLVNSKNCTSKVILKAVESHLNSNTYTFNLILSLITLSEIKSLETMASIIKIPKETSIISKESKYKCNDLLEISELLGIHPEIFGLISTILEIKFNHRNIERFYFIGEAIRMNQLKKANKLKEANNISEATRLKTKSEKWMLHISLNFLLNDTGINITENQTAEILSLVKMYTGDKMEWKKYLKNEIEKIGFNELNPNIVEYAHSIIEKMGEKFNNDVEYSEEDLELTSLYSLMDRDIKIGLPEKWELELTKKFILEDIEGKYPNLRLAFQLMRAILKNDSYMIALLANEGKNFHRNYQNKKTNNEEVSESETKKVLERFKSLSISALLKHFVKNQGLQTEIRSVFSTNFLGEESNDTNRLKFFVACISGRPEYVIRNIDVQVNKTLLYSYYIWFRLPDLAKLYSVEFFKPPRDRNVISRFLILPILIFYREYNGDSEVYSRFLDEYESDLRKYEGMVLDILDIYCFKNLTNERNILSFVSNFKNGLYEDLKSIKDMKSLFFDKIDGYQKKVNFYEPKLYYFIDVLGNMLDSNFTFNTEFKSNLQNLLKNVLPNYKPDFINRLGLLINTITSIQKLTVCTKRRDFKYMTTIFIELVLDIMKFFEEKNEPKQEVIDDIKENDTSSEKPEQKEDFLLNFEGKEEVESVELAQAEEINKIKEDQNEIAEKFKSLIRQSLSENMNNKDDTELEKVNKLKKVLRFKEPEEEIKKLKPITIEEMKTIFDSLKVLVNNPAFPYNNFKDYIHLIKNILDLLYKNEDSAVDSAKSNNLQKSTFFQCSVKQKLEMDDFINEKKEQSNIISSKLQSKLSTFSDIIINICEASFKVIEFMKDQEKSSNKDERRLVIIKFIGLIIDNFFYVLKENGTTFHDFYSIKKKLKVIFKNIVFLTKAEFEFITPDIHFLFGTEASEFGKIKNLLIGFREVVRGPQLFIETKFSWIMERIIDTNLAPIQNILRKFSVTEELSISDLFKLVDKDRSGNISLQEFKVLTRRLNIDLTDHRIKEIFTSVKLRSEAESTSELALDEKEFDLSIGYLQNKSIMLALETLGLTEEFLTGLLLFLIFVLLVIFAFIFIGVEAFAIAGTFGAVVNSSFPVAGGAVLSRRSQYRYVYILEREEYKSTVNKCVRIVQSMKI